MKGSEQSGRKTGKASAGQAPLQTWKEGPQAELLLQFAAACWMLGRDHLLEAAWLGQAFSPGHLGPFLEPRAGALLPHLEN